jgi:hypothetical protein
MHTYWLACGAAAVPWKSFGIASAKTAPSQACINNSRRSAAMNTAAEKLQIARINRKLAKQYEKLRTSRSYGEESNLGRFYVLDISRNCVTYSHITDLDEFEKDLAAA